MAKSIKYRKEPVGDAKHLFKFKSIKENWSYTYDKLTLLNKILNDSFKDESFSVVVAGSYGRYEASENSDLDFLIVSLKPLKDGAQIAKKVRAIITEKTKIIMPNPKGVFNQLVVVEEIIKIAGSDKDDLNSLAQRILLILESRAIYNEQLFNTALQMILKKYLSDIIKDPTKDAMYFMNDVIRYFRAICVNYQHNFWEEKEKWTLRLVKLGHSRVIMYAGTLLLIMNASKLRDSSKYDYFFERLDYTPLERIADVYFENKDLTFSNIAMPYDSFLRKISDPIIRKALKVSHEERYDNPHFMDLKISADRIRSELTRFVIAMKRKWTDQVFEYALF